MVRKGPNTCKRENSLKPSIPGVVAKDQGAGGLAQALAQLRRVVQLKEGIRQLRGIAWSCEQSADPVLDKCFQLANPAGHYRQARRHVFVNLQRRKIEVR